MKKTVLSTIAIVTLTTLGVYSLVSLREKETKKEQTSCCKKSTKATPKVDLFGLASKPRFNFLIDSRFTANRSLNQVKNAHSMQELLPPEATLNIDTFRDVTIQLYGSDKNRSSKNTVLSKKQKEMMRKMNYSDAYIVEAVSINKEKDRNREDRFTYYVSITPENEAYYLSGNQLLINHLRRETMSLTENVTKNRLRPGRIHFTVDVNGELKNVKIQSSCGYEKIDNKMLELFKNLPNKWKSATNHKGVKVEQELCYFYGLAGC